MGNRAFICFENNPINIYVHWNGGIESVKAFCDAAKERGFADPTSDASYAMARLIGLIHEFFGVTDSSSLGVCTFSSAEEEIDAITYADNGKYIIGKDWQIICHYQYSYDDQKRVELATTLENSSDKDKQQYEQIKSILIEHGKRIEQLDKEMME